MTTARRAAAALVCAALPALGFGALAAAVKRRPPPRPAGAAPSARAAESGTWVDQTLGLSGRLRLLFVQPDQAARLLDAGLDLAAPGLHVVDGRGDKTKSPLALAVLTAFAQKKNGRIDGYHLGDWPGEPGTRTSPYPLPQAFLRVTKESAKTRVSEHFDAGDFLTKDQAAIWPKYLVLDPRLLDKLELLIVELAREGHPVRGLHVMSGFRTPAYNALDVGPGSRSAVSRHMYGDAADVYPDDDKNGVIDDLNGDHRVDLDDARVVQHAAEVVESNYPSLVGGIGLYAATSAHGPFVHVDVRGQRARWAEAKE